MVDALPDLIPRYGFQGGAYMLEGCGGNKGVSARKDGFFVIGDECAPRAGLGPEWSANLTRAAQPLAVIYADLPRARL